MKRNFFLLALLLLGLVTNAQVLKPVKWLFTAKKISTGVYELQLAATISSGWHIYSQTTPAGGPVPSTVSFNKNPLVSMEGKLKEVGKMEQRHEPLFGVDVKQFSKKVVFVQTVKVKANTKTSITGEVEFMVCNDKQCLPPSKEKFTIALK